MVFGETVRAHRRRLAMSQEDLSGKARIGVRTIRDIEAGRSGTPRPTTLRLLADAFGLHGSDRDRFHELAHHHATREAKVADTISDDDTAGGAVEKVPHHVVDGRAAARASSRRSEDSSLGPGSNEGIHTTRPRITLPARWGALVAAKTVDIADHKWLATAMLGVARGGWLSFDAAARRIVPAFTVRLARGIEPLNDWHWVARNSALWVPLISISAAVLTLYLLAIGETGQSIATVLAVPFAIYAVAQMVSRRPSWPAGLAIDGRRKLMIGASAVVLGAVLPGAIWWGMSRSSVLDVELGSSFQLADGGSRLVEATSAQGQWEGRLAFTPRLVSNSVANDCVLPTWLIIAAEVDGQILDSTRARHGQRVWLPIPASTRQVRVRIEYVDPGKQGCVVTVTLSSAALER